MVKRILAANIVKAEQDQVVATDSEITQPALESHA
jgi:hypothetical protein